MRMASLIFFALVSPAIAAPCLPEGEAPGFLRERYGEVLQSSAKARGGQVIETYASPKGSWTMVVVSNGTACMLIEGVGFKDIPQGVAG